MSPCKSYHFKPHCLNSQRSVRRNQDVSVNRFQFPLQLCIERKRRLSSNAIESQDTPPGVGISIGNASLGDTWRVLTMILQEKLNPISLNMKNFVVARERGGGRVVGAGQLKPIGKASDKDAFELSSIVVDDSYRGRGIGKSIVRYILDHKAPAGAKVYLLTVEDQQGFYTPFGFDVTTDAPMMLSLERLIGSVVARLAVDQGLVIMAMSENE